MKSRTFSIVSVIGMIVLLVAFAGTMIYIDPLFHFHAPKENIGYLLFDERYQNNGITRNFVYNTIITGTSMTENFKTSQVDELFDAKSIKVPVSGARYKEVDEIVKKAYSYKDNIANVIRCLDLTTLISDKDSQEYAEYPEYLYDDDVWNDVWYVLNKEIFITFTDADIQFTHRGGKLMSMDSYKNWNGQYNFDGNALKKGYTRKDIQMEMGKLSKEDKELLTGNLNQNVISTVVAHPETEFYFFFPPYSILYWDDIVRTGKFTQMVEAQKIAIEMLLPYNNVHLYSFFDDYIMICDLNNYIDSVHYGQNYSDRIIQNMADGIGMLTKENYENYLTMLNFYNLFDYDAFFEQ